MKTLCYSVRLQCLTQISEKAYKATCFDGTTDIIPASQVFGQDYDVMKSDAYWISAWILSKKNLQYSNKKQAWFDEQKRQLPNYDIEYHKAEKKEKKENNEIKELRK